MMLFVLFNYQALRTSKDALVISAGGASVIPFLKGYVVFPASIAFVLLYSKLISAFSKQTVFYIISSGFLCFYLLFSTVLYPFRDALHPSLETVATWSETIPALKYFISIFATWSFSIYYVLAELWGSAMLSLLFWQLANDVTTTKEAKRFYPMFGLIGNIGLILSGVAGKKFYHISKQFPDNQWGVNLSLIASSIIVSGIGTILCYKYLNKKDNNEDNNSTEPKPSPKKKPKLSPKESMKLLVQSKYLLLIATLVICYGISMNLIDILLKNQLNALLKDPNDYNEFLQNISIGTGVFTMLTILFSKGIVQKFGWLKGAIITPLIILITGAAFFSFSLFPDSLSGIGACLSMSPLLISVWIGTFQNILSKGVKYGLFDPTKEMAYIPLDDELKTKGGTLQGTIETVLGQSFSAKGLEIRQQMSN